MAQGHGLSVWGDGPENEASRVVRENDPLPVGFIDSDKDAFGRVLISNPFEVFDNKSIASRNRNQWEEPVSGVILTYNTLSGTFQDGEEIRGLLPIGFISIGIINTDNGSDSMNLDLLHNDFQVGDTVTGQTSSATAVIVSTDTGSDIQYNYNRSSVFLKIGAGANDLAVRQSHRYHPYVPEKSHKITSTYVMGTGTTIALVVRSSTSGSPVDTVIEQKDWNVDRLDGKATQTNPSRLILDFTKIQIQKIDFQWLGAGRVRYGFSIGGKLIKVHEINNANEADVVYMKTPTLPIRYKIYRSGDDVIKEVGYGDDLNGLFIRYTGPYADSDKQLEEICSSVVSEGGYTLPGLEFSVSTQIVPKAVTDTEAIPVLAIRLKNNYPAGQPNRTVARFLSAGFMVQTNDAHIEVMHIHEPIDITATWNDVGGGSAVEYSTDISTVTGRPTHEIEEQWGPTAQAGKSAARTLTGEFINLHSFLSQSFDSDNSELFVIYAHAFTGTANVSAHISWLEAN